MCVCLQLECVVRLVQVGCEVNTVSSRFNQTPTHTAAFGGHPHCVLWLTQAGADVNRQVSRFTDSGQNLVLIVMCYKATCVQICTIVFVTAGV